MTPQQMGKRAERAATEPLVISKIEGGFRVYSPTGSAKPYVVGGTAEAPTCTCPDFALHRSDLEWRCKHILAVFRPAGAAPVPSLEAAEHPEAGTLTPHETALRRRAEPSNGNGRDATMVLKRSISPDGRIDSLSVEIAAPVNGLQPSEVEARALRVLKLQDGIVGQFLKRTGKAMPASTPEAANDGCAPAQLLGVGGADGKWGRRLFLIIQMNGRRLRLYGTKKQLTEHLTTAGYPKVATDVEEGLALNLPCRIATKPSADGKFLNVERVLPAGQPNGQRG